MVTVLLIVVLVGLAVATWEVASSRRGRRDDTRSQLDALSRVVEPQRRRMLAPRSDDGLDGGDGLDPLE